MEDKEGPESAADKIASPNHDKAWGAFLKEAPEDWQILQQDDQGFASVKLRGTWAAKESMGLLGSRGGEVQCRVVREETGAPVNAALDWRTAETSSEGTWSAEFRIPAGGPYRLETRFNPKGNKLGEWSLRGDMRHFVGVGDLWIIAGQSNASGYGRAAYQDAPELGLHVLRHHGKWSLASHPLGDSTATEFPANRENYNTGHSPFLHFARSLKKELGHPIGLIPAALGGSPLSSWHPEDGPLFANLKAMLARAGGYAKGIVWYQGESDAEPGKASDYLERFLSAVEGWRNRLNLPGLPVLTVQLARYLSANPGEEDAEWSQVREAQRQAGLRAKGVSVVPALDLGLDDTIHVGTSGNLVLAERLARCALGSVYGKAVEWRAPDLVEAAGEGDNSVRLKFVPVASRLESHDPKAMPYRVEDEAGEVPVEKAVYFQRDGVKLFLGRALQGRTTISCGYGENPPVLPMDVERQIPVMAFHHAPVSR